MSRKTVYHPTAVGVTNDVPEDDVKDWQASGWAVTKPKAWGDAEPAEDPAAGAAQSTT